MIIWQASRGELIGNIYLVRDDLSNNQFYNLTSLLLNETSEGTFADQRFYNICYAGFYGKVYRYVENMGFRASLCINIVLTFWLTIITVSHKCKVKTHGQIPSARIAISHKLHIMISFILLNLIQSASIGLRIYWEEVKIWRDRNAVLKILMLEEIRAPVFLLLWLLLLPDSRARMLHELRNLTKFAKRKGFDLPAVDQQRNGAVVLPLDNNHVSQTETGNS